MRAFYPITTEKVIHRGKTGNTYRLDGIEKCISIRKDLKGDTYYDVQDISVDHFNIDELVSLINTVHSPKILESYKSGIPVELANASGVMWQPDLYNFALESALVSKFAAEEANSEGRSLAIVGGGHHAEHSKPFGFCVVNTMAIAAQVLTSLGKDVAIIDLDTHYSNGCFDILHSNKSVRVYSLWNQTLDKWKYFESKDNIWHKKVTDSIDYFTQLQGLTKDVLSNKPDILIYHLGLDVLASDRMGGVPDINEEDLIKRDKLIRDLVYSLNVPFVIFLGGAYIDWSKGEDRAKTQRDHLTRLQHTLLDVICK